MRTIAKHIFILMMVTLLCSCAQKSSEKILLSLDNKVGDEYSVVFETSASSGPDFKIEDYTEVGFKIIGHQDNEYAMTADLIKMTADSKMFDEIEHYDSEMSISDMTDSEKMMHMEFKELLDGDFTISVDSKGNITKPFSYAAGNDLDYPIIDMSVVQLRFPPDSVGIGDSWTNEKENVLTGQQTTSTYSISDISETEVTVSGTSVISALGQILKENKATVEYVLDRKTCNLISGSIKMNLQQGGSTTNTFYTK